MKTSDNNNNQNRVANELALLKLAHQKLEHRHTALFKLNQLSQDCDELSSFYHQVHLVIKSLMTAENFYIVMFDRTLDTLKFVYHVDEEDDTPEGDIPYASFKGSLTSYVIETGKAFLAMPTEIDRMVKNGVLNYMGTTGMDWLGVPLLHDAYVIGVMAVQSYSESTRYSDQDKELLTYAAQHIISALIRLQDHEQLQKAVASRTTELME